MERYCSRINRTKRLGMEPGGNTIQRYGKNRLPSASKDSNSSTFTKFKRIRLYIKFLVFRKFICTGSNCFLLFSLRTSFLFSRCQSILMLFQSRNVFVWYLSNLFFNRCYTKVLNYVVWNVWVVLILAYILGFCCILILLIDHKWFYYSLKYNHMILCMLFLNGSLSRSEFQKVVYNSLNYWETNLYVYYF